MEISKFFMGVFLLATNYTNNKNDQPKKKNDCAQDTQAQCIHSLISFAPAQPGSHWPRMVRGEKAPHNQSGPKKKERNAARRVRRMARRCIGMVRHRINSFSRHFFLRSLRRRTKTAGYRWVLSPRYNVNTALTGRVCVFVLGFYAISTIYIIFLHSSILIICVCRGNVLALPTTQRSP